MHITRVISLSPQGHISFLNTWVTYAWIVVTHTMDIFHQLTKYWEIDECIE